MQVTIPGMMRHCRRLLAIKEYRITAGKPCCILDIALMKILLTGSAGPKVAARVATMLAGSHPEIGVDQAPSSMTFVVADITFVGNSRR